MIDSGCNQYIIKELDFFSKLKLERGLVKIENETNLSLWINEMCGFIQLIDSNGWLLFVTLKERCVVIYIDGT